jgi:hypothetical protein
MFWRSRKNPVGHHNVNDEWEGSPDEALSEETAKESVR